MANAVLHQILRHFRVVSAIALALPGLYGCGATGNQPRDDATGGQGGPDAQKEDWDIAHQNASLGAGINLGNCLDAPEEGDWGHVLEKEDFDFAAEWGFQHIRLPVRWNRHSASAAPYTIDTDFFDRVDWAIEQASQRDLRVVVDVHHFDELNADRAKYADQLTGIWKQIAEHYADYGPELYFELYNEPHTDFPAEEWNEWVATLVKTIRKTNPKRSIIVGGVDYNHISGLEQLVLPDDDHLIATYHFYDPVTFVYQGAGEWVPGSENWIGTKWYGTDAEVKAIDDEFARVEAWQAKNKNIPVYLGEWGTTRVGDLASRVRYSAFIAQSCNERNFGWAIWDMHTELGLHDEATGEVTTEIIDALRDPSATFAATRTTPPTIEIPAGPNVLLDDFENTLGDRSDQSYLASAHAQSVSSTAEHSEWFTMASADSSWLAASGVRLVTFEEFKVSGAPMNFAEALTLESSDGKNQLVKLDGKLGSSASAYLGLGALLSKDYYADFVDLCSLEAISFRARGEGSLIVDLVTSDVINGYKEGDNWGHFAAKATLTKDFTQFVITTDSLRPREWSEAASDNLMWKDACNEVSALEFIASTPTVKLELDDLRLHGVAYSTFGFEFVESP